MVCHSERSEESQELKVILRDAQDCSENENFSFSEQLFLHFAEKYDREVP